MNTFAKILDQYIKKSDCSAAVLAKEAGISPSGLSRYRNGDRTPDYDIIEKLSDILSCHKAGEKEEIKNALSSLAEDRSPEYPQLGQRLNELTVRYDINLNALANHMGFDPSFISRIKGGGRYPAKPEHFIESVADYILKSPSYDFQMTKEDLVSYLKQESSPSKGLIEEFSERLSSLDIEDLTPVRPARNLQYRGEQIYSEPKGLETAISDLSSLLYFARTKNEIYILIDANCDIKELLKIAVSKGVHVNLYFNIASNLSKTISELNGFVDYFKTGLVTPFYLPKKSSGIFSHALISTGVYSLFGEWVTDNREKGRFTLSGEKEDVLQVRRYAKQIFEMALPVMDITNPSNIQIFHPGLSALLKPYVASKETL